MTQDDKFDAWFNKENRHFDCWKELKAQLKLAFLGGCEEVSESLRDQFAMSALQGLLVGEADNFKTPDHAAQAAYKLADAMLIARNGAE